MSQEKRLYHVIKDPVHGTMQFTDLENRWIKPFIDSPDFQRLRHIKQMGMGDFIFPGAVHSRFSHCLGCCYVASQISQKIGLEETGRQLVMLACLLHDIGHGPFSHVFEDLFYQRAIRHEAWTPFFLKAFRTADFFRHYNALNPAHPLTDEKFDQIERMIMHNSPSNPLLADIVSSQLDADRLDYLLRDNHFCGVTYGVFDLRWMLHSMVTIPTPEGPRLGITHKGIGVTEHYLMARRLMTQNIYHHRKKLALEFFLIQLLATLAESLEQEPAFEEIRQTAAGEFLVAVNRFNHAAAQPEADIPSLSQAFLEDQYADYRELCDYDIFSILRMLATLKEDHPAIRLAKRIHYRRLPGIVDVPPLTATRIRSLVAEFQKTHAGSFEPWQLALIESPHHSYLAEADPIMVAVSPDTHKPLETLSPLIRDISGHTEQTVFLCIDREIAGHPDIQHLLAATSQETA